jgi:hypothetical protein
MYCPLAGVIAPMLDKQDPHQAPRQQINHWPFAFATFFIFYYLFNIALPGRPEALVYSEFIQKITQDEIQSVNIQGLELKGKYQT